MTVHYECTILVRIAFDYLQEDMSYKAKTHIDKAAVCVKDEEVDEAQAYIEQCMRWTPEWAEGLPVNCESGVGKSYGECG